MKIAAIAACWNEEVLLPQFIEHYRLHVDRIILIDNKSTDRSKQIADSYSLVEWREYDTEGFYKEREIHKAKLEAKESCKGEFDWVLFLDVDEFVVPKWEGWSLNATIEALDKMDWYATEGCQMIPAKRDAPYNAKTPLTKQFKRGVKTTLYSKPIIVRPEADLPFTWGFHEISCVDPKLTQDPALSRFYLLHYQMFDEGHYIRRMIARQRRLHDDNLKCDWKPENFYMTEADYANIFTYFQNHPDARILPI